MISDPKQANAPLLPTIVSGRSSGSSTARSINPLDQHRLAAGLDVQAQIDLLVVIALTRRQPARGDDLDQGEP